MIIAIANDADGAGKAMLASQLAAMRTRQGRKVLLIDDDPGRSSLRAALENPGPQYNDVVIDTEGRDTLASRSALIAAKLAVVAIHANHVDLANDYKLIARLNSARMFNPGLRVLFVIVGNCCALSPQELAAVRTYVGHVMSATLACTVIHEPAASDQAAAYGRCDCDGLDTPAAAEMRALYREIFAN